MDNIDSILQLSVVRSHRPGMFFLSFSPYFVSYVATDSAGLSSTQGLSADTDAASWSHMQIVGLFALFLAASGCAALGWLRSIQRSIQCLARKKIFFG